MSNNKLWKLEKIEKLLVMINNSSVLFNSQQPTRKSGVLVNAQILFAIVAALITFVLNVGCAHIRYDSPDQPQTLQVSGRGDLKELPAVIGAVGEYQGDQDATRQCDEAVKAFDEGRISSVVCISNGRMVCRNTDPLGCLAHTYGGSNYGTMLNRVAPASEMYAEMSLQLFQAEKALQAERIRNILLKDEASRTEQENRELKKYVDSLFEGQ